MDINFLTKHIETQLHNIMCADIDVSKYVENALMQAQKSYSASANKYLLQLKDSIDPFHSGFYLILLYCLSREMFKVDGHGANAEKIYYLNKVLNSVDIFYEVELPDIFGIEHPIGSVMGRAAFSNYFFFYQGCTVGGSGGAYPVIGEHVTMYSNSKILGNTRVGNHVMLAANTYIVDCQIPDYSIVFPSIDARFPKIVPVEQGEMLEREKNFWGYQF